MKYFSSILFFTLIFGLAYSVPLSDREDAMNQLLLDIKDLLAEERFNHVQAREQGVMSSLPWSLDLSSLYNPSLPSERRRRIGHQTDLTKDTLLKIMGLSSGNIEWPSTTTAPVSRNEADLQGFKELLREEAMRYTRDKLRAIIQQQPCTGNRCTSAKKQDMHRPIKVKGALGYLPSIEAEAEIPDDGMRYFAFNACLGSIAQKFAEAIKLDKNYGIYDSDSRNSGSEEFAKYIINLFSKTHDINEVIKDVGASLIRLLKIGGGDSEELVGNIQGINWDFLKRFGPDLVKKIAELFPHLNVKDESMKEILQNVVNIAVELIQPSLDNLSLNRSISSLINGLADERNWSDEYKELIRKTIEKGIPVLHKIANGKEPSKEEKLDLLDRVVRMLIYRVDFGKEDTDLLVSLVHDQFDYFFTNGHVRGELSPELQSLMLKLYIKMAMSLSDLKSGQEKQLSDAGLLKCAEELEEGIRNNLPLLSGIGAASEGFDMNAGSWKLAQEEKMNRVRFTVPSQVRRGRFTVPSRVRRRKPKKMTN